MDNKNVIWIGVLLVIAGVVLLVSQLSGWQWRWDMVWPLFLLIPGVPMLLSVNRKGNEGAIFPGIILVCLAILFFIINSEILGPNMGYSELWPMFVIIPGIAFLGLFAMKPQDKGVLVPAAACLITGTVFLSARLAGWVTLIAPVAIVVVGLLVIVGAFTKKKEQQPKSQEILPPEIK